LAPRALSIGVNQNRDETAHTFMLKRNDEAEPLDLTEAIVSDQQKTFREMLQKATVDSTKRPRFATFPKPGEAPSVEFEEEIRKLADFGRGLYRAIFIRSGKKMQKELRAIAASADDTIQIVRLHPNFAFPWPALHDFHLIALAGYFLFEGKFVGTAQDLAGIFFWAFGLDITVDALLQVAKGIKTS
jgi:hypothetical protein